MSGAAQVMEKSAVLSDCGTYRYSLTRRWGPAETNVVWVMLNPSTADAEVDDPTIRRCIAFTKAWGYHGLTVVNRYALRSADPKALLRADDPCGPDNFEHGAVHLSDDATAFVVAAWGAFKVDRPGLPVASMCAAYRTPLRCLGTTKDGWPKHPLYLPAVASLRLWPDFKEERR